MWCSVTNTSLNNSREATHDTTLSRPNRWVSSWEGDGAVGLTVDAWGKTDLVFYEDTLDAPVYQDILKNSLLPAAKEWFGDEKEGWELQQDKATCHTAKSTKAWLERHEVAVVEEWLTKGDDINPIENLWAILDERLESKKFTTEEGIITSLIPFQIVCEELGRPKRAQ